MANDLAAIDDDGHSATVRLRQLVLLSEPPRHGLDLEPLMGERHPGSPAERAEATLRLGAGEIVKGDGHLLHRRCWGSKRLLWPPPPPAQIPQIGNARDRSSMRRQPPYDRQPGEIASWKGPEWR